MIRVSLNLVDPACPVGADALHFLRADVADAVALLKLLAPAAQAKIDLGELTDYSITVAPVANPAIDALLNG